MLEIKLIALLHSALTSAITRTPPGFRDLYRISMDLNRTDRLVISNIVREATTRSYLIEPDTARNCRKNVLLGRRLYLPLMIINFIMLSLITK